MPSPDLELERIGRVGVCTLDRPEVRNALSASLMASLTDAIAALDADPGVGCIVITGSDDAFASGPEVESLAQTTLPAELTDAATALWSELADCRTPLIAAVRGWALSSGCELALACDMLVAEEKATFGMPEITLGMIPGGGGTQRLARVAGRQRAMELILTGRRFYVPEADEMGLINQVAKRGNCMQDALLIAETIAARPAAALALAKRAIRAAEELPLSQGLELERELYDQALAGEDRLEGVHAFLEKRPPTFEGH